MYLFTYHSGTGVEYFRTGPRTGMGSVLTSVFGRSVVVVGRFLRVEVSNPGFQVRECSVGPPSVYMQLDSVYEPSPVWRFLNLTKVC